MTVILNEVDKRNQSASVINLVNIDTSQKLRLTENSLSLSNTRPLARRPRQ